ncbi:MAG: hypothetical protein H6Q74_683 [Firmicutes bacterium]|nr:hypothetical protein [Bacillota bacterium]
MQIISTKSLVFAALFIALSIIFTHVFAIQTTFIRIDFGFLAIAICSMMFGPLIGGTVAAIADIIGCMIFTPNLYFPGFSLSAFAIGIIYGLFFHNRSISLVRSFLANIVILLFVSLAMNTIWLSILYNKAVTVIVYSRLLKCAIMLPGQSLLVYLLQKRLSSYAFKQPKAENF